MNELNNQNNQSGKRRGLWEKGKVKRKLLAIEKVTLAYTLFTMFLLVFFAWEMEHPLIVLMERVLILLGMGGVYYFHLRRPCKATRLLRTVFPILLLGFWYPDIWVYNYTLENMDHVFANYEYLAFISQPSVEFSKVLSGVFWRELFNMGYFSYYIFIVGAFIVTYRLGRRWFEKASFVIIASFLAYYTIYLFLPVAGPHYYFSHVHPSSVAAGMYPSVGLYFQTHAELLNVQPPTGFFSWLVHIMQSLGERPIAAFPSSHVGISTVIMLLFFRHHRKLCYFCLPFYVLLCLSTVYIGAHYAVDAIAGLVTGVLLYKLMYSWYSVLHVKG